MEETQHISSAIVIGGSRGIGLALAAALIQDGRHVHIAVRLTESMRYRRIHRAHVRAGIV